MGPPGGLKSPTEEQSSTAQIADSSDLSYTTHPVMKRGLEKGGRAAAIKEVTTWTKITPTKNSLDEAEWPLLNQGRMPIIKSARDENYLPEKGR